MLTHHNSPNTYSHRWFAMGTIWELAIMSSRTEDYLQTVAEEVEAEVERLENQLSFYRPTSELSDINRRAYWEAVTVDPKFFDFLQRVKQLSEETKGAFDPTIAPLMRCWGFVGGSGEMPKLREIEAARFVVGMSHVFLNSLNCSVQFDQDGVTLEFGAVGKGYAVDCALEILKTYEIESAILHGGTSTIYGLGSPPDQDGWLISIQTPNLPEGETFKTVSLQNKALSVSAPHGKYFEENGKRYGHVLDPRTGYPAQVAILAAVVTDSAMESDALSTALLTLGEEGRPLIQTLRPESIQILVAQ